jgi:hypothetical protein
LVSSTTFARGARPVFPPRVAVAVKAFACELPKQRGLPLSRYSTRALADLVMEQGIAASISGTTVWRWLTHDAIRPWTFRSWIFPRDPAFAAKAGRVLDLYHGEWDGVRLRPDEYVLSADEKPSIQARARTHPTTASAPGRLSASSMSTSAPALWYIWRHGTSIGRNSSAAASPRAESLRSMPWWHR